MKPAIRAAQTKTFSAIRQTGRDFFPMTRSSANIFFFFLAALVLLPGTPCAAADPDMQRIFILHSYEKNHICGQPQHDGVMAALKAENFLEGKNISVKTYYMDTKKKNNTPALIAKEARHARELVDGFAPHVVVTLDDNAFRTVGLDLSGKPVQIVFSGMNVQPEKYNRQTRFMADRKNPGGNITGVYEKLHIADAVRVQKKILPDLQKVCMLTDRSPTGRALTKQVQIELTETRLPVAFDIKIVSTWEDYQEKIRRINQDPAIGTIYPVALLLKDSTGKTYTAPEILRWTVEHCTKPAIALNYAFTYLGLFGGAAVDFKAMGYQAGKMVARILQGESAGEIPIEEAQRYALVFNLDRIRQLNIDIPEDILLAADEVVARETPLPCTFRDKP